MTSLELFFQDGDPQTWGLIVDTSSFEGALLVVSSKGVVLDSRSWNKEFRHSKVILKNFVELKNKFGANKLKHIFFVQGPGSFTGLRVGAAFIKSLSFALTDVKITSISSFLSVAHRVIESHPDIEDFHVLIPSIGSKSFSAQFKSINGSWIENVNLEGASEDNYFLDNSFSSFEQSLSHNAKIFKIETSINDLVSAVFDRTAITPYLKNHTYLDLYPLYLRKSEAEEKNRYDKAKL